MNDRRPFIAAYIMASGRKGTLYVGVTSDLYRRVWEHRTGRFDGFSAEYGCTQLVWFEQHELVTMAIRRERRLKHWLRQWKLDLIEAGNPEWRDLAADW
jgi:putative endonuclease